MYPEVKKLLRDIPSISWISLIIILFVSPLRATYPPLECPTECACHYFRINWVTECSSKSLTTVPSGISQSVYILDLSKNKISGQNESLSFPEGIKVRRLHLADNKMTEVTKDTFVGLSYLLEVDLSGNSISKFDHEAFLQSPGLISLELRRNPLTGSENGKPFIVSRSLKTLDLSDCRLRQLSAGFFDEAIGVTELDLSGNPLEMIDIEALKPLRSLEKLKMNRCRLTSVDPNLFQTTQHLKYFEAAWNPKLFGGSDGANLQDLLKGLNRLDHLDLRGTGLKNVPSESFQDTVELGCLMLADNDISASSLTISSSLSNLKNLHELDLSGCHLNFTTLSFLANMTKIRILRLGRNDLSQTLIIPVIKKGDSAVMDLDWSISHLHKIKRLSMDHCELTRLPSSESFTQLSEVLLELDVSDNPLGGFGKDLNKDPDLTTLSALSASIKQLKMLQTLDMSRCELSQLLRDTFSKSIQLRRLVLSGNQLTTKKEGKRMPGLEAGLLSPAHRLEILELADCGFTELPSPDSMPESKRDEDYSAETDRKKKKERMDDDEDAILDTMEEEAGPNLRELVLAGNLLMLDDPLPPYVSSLEKLDLSRCGLTRIAPNALIWAVNLTHLSLSGNPLGSAEKSVEAAPNLNVVASKSNEVQNGKHLEAFKESSNSTQIDIHPVEDKMATFDISFISHLPKIRSLDLRRCGLTSLSHSVLTNVSLESLRLAGNPWNCSCNLVELWEWASRTGKDILLHRPPPIIGAPVVAAASIEEEHGLRCTARDGTRIPWSRYILSTHQLHECGPPPPKLVAIASLLHQEPEQVELSPSVSTEVGLSSSWAALIWFAVILLFVVISVVLVLAVLARRRNNQIKCETAKLGHDGNVLLNLDEEDIGQYGMVRWATRPYRDTTQP